VTADELAKVINVPRRTLFWMRKRHEGAPDNFDDVSGWRTFIESNSSSTKPKPAPKPAARPAQTKLLSDSKTEAPTEEPAANPATASNLNYVAARALRTQTAAELDLIKLEATRRNIIRKEEVKVIFQRIAAVVRGRFLKVRYDLPCACVGLTEAQIDKVVGEKFEYAMAALDIPSEFFEPASVV
jgi:hypothetical protein